VVVVRDVLGQHLGCVHAVKVNEMLHVEHKDNSENSQDCTLLLDKGVNSLHSSE
jgi:hypothetical protein